MLRLFAVLTLLVTPLGAQDFDVCVYGATPAGIAAAVAAESDGAAVLLVEPGRRIGGMITNGLTHTDFRTFEGLSGAFLDFARRVEAHYREKYGSDSEQVRDCLRGTQFEPGVALTVFEKMLTEHPRVTVWRGRSLAGLRFSTDGERRAVEIASLMDDEGGRYSVAARIFIDASYEGDLMAAANVPYRVGREARAEFGESLAPVEADSQLQAYNFRLTMTREPGNRIPPRKPPGYDRGDYAEVVALLEAGKIKRVFDVKPNAIFKAQEPRLPNGKYDINDVSHSIVRLSLPGANKTWPDGSVGNIAPFSRTGLMQARSAVFDEHLRWNVGLLYFLQNDESVPAKARDEAREWGLCKDEFTDNGHLPHQLYVREARRMDGMHLFSERDTDNAPGDARGVLKKDSVAVGDYGENCHGTGHEGPRAGGRHTGEFYKSVVPYQVPYGVLVPKPGLENLLVCGAVSSTHVGFCALRLEPIWMSLGQAAGHAAQLAVQHRRAVQEVPVADLQKRLHKAGSATIYVSDVPPGHADFAAVQWWGTLGGLHGLAPMPEKAGLRGKNITGQYYEAYPYHEAGLDLPLTLEQAARWRDLAEKNGVPNEKIPASDVPQTRGDWIRACARAAGR